jgi:transcriptional regulator with XRE-family HTH domain
MAGDRRLGERLRALREAGISGQPVAQSVVARAFGKSVPLVSSWEKGKALPSPEWLHAYARLFATPRSYVDGQPRLLTLEDLREDELDRFENLHRELMQLRSACAERRSQVTDELTTRSPWEGLWHFADGSPVTLVCARLPAERALAEPDSPDYVALYAYSDLDALLELYGHVCAANPGVAVHHKLADELSQSDVTNHLVLLGGVTWNPLTRRVMESLHLPVVQEQRAPDDPDAGSFQLRAEAEHPATFRARLEGEAPHRRIVEDVAQFCRAPNPYNRKRSVTICNGAHGRGTYAAVRTLTDPRFRDRNRVYLERRYRPQDTYNILARVDIVAGEVITPDWTQPGTVLHEWRAP